MRRYSRLAKLISTTLSAASAVGGCLVSAASMASPPSTSPYATDVQNSHVEDATSEGIGQVNMIACVMHAMRPDLLVNQPSYIALVDENKCSANKSSTSNSSGGDASQASSYTTTIVNSTRATNADPMRVKVWLNEEEDGQASTIFVNISATAAPTTSNPYGQFRLDFCGKGATGPCMMNGMLQGADGALDYYQVEQRGGGESSTTALRLTSVGTTTGSGKLDMIRTQGNTSQEAAFLFSYDANHFLRGDQCFSRDASDPATGLSVWRYGLYDSVTGVRVDRDSGFPINFTNGGQTYHGFIGYWGINMPSAAGLTNGATVQKVVYANNSAPTTTDYTAVLAGGKLTKYTKKSTNLHAIDKVQINTFVGNVTNFFAGATANSQYQMYWDDVQSKFVVTGMMNCSQNGCQAQDLSTPQLVSPSFWSQQGLQGNSQSLGGELYIDLKSVGSTVTSSSINVVYRQQDLVYPSDFPSALYCVNNCPTSGSLAAYFAPNSTVPSPFVTATNNNWNPSATYVTYGSDMTLGVLTTANAVVNTDMDAYSQHPQYRGGVRSGRLFTDPSAVACNGNMYCDYKANDLDVYYVWETGPNNWNQFAAIKNANNTFVKFDAPLQLNYVVPTGSQYGQYAGKTIVLQYGGFGNLWGIPGSCVSSVNNQPVSCDQQNARYVPEFVIPSDETNGQVTDGTNTYLVKWLDREIRFARKPLSACAALTLPANVTLPTSAVLKDPSDANSDIYIGVKPTVTGEPRVIHGDVKF